MPDRLASLASLLIIAGLLPFNLEGQTAVNAATRQAIAPAMASFARLPLAFERRQGGGKDRYLARGEGYTIGLEDGKATVAVGTGAKAEPVTLEFAGSHAAPASPGPQLPGKINVIRGNDPRNWLVGLPTYARVTYADTYPGIDVVYYGNRQQLEFDLLVKPGADPRAIRLRVGGAGNLSIDGSGALELHDALGVRVALPLIYQEVGGAKKSIAGHYAIVSRNEVAFRVDSWDRTRTLVIDPTIVFSTQLGGGLNTSSASSIAVDSSGNILIVGTTSAGDFPIVDPAQDSLNGVTTNAFVSKIDASGTSLIYSTYLGGSSTDTGTAVAVDSFGSAWVTGTTQSTNFPTLNAAQGTFGGAVDAFVAKLNTAGALQFSTYMGGPQGDKGYAIAVDSSGNGYVAGYTDGQFPTTTGVIAPGGAGDAFAAKYSPGGSVVYSAQFGGAAADGGYGIAVDSEENAYVTGITSSTSFTGAPAGGAQPANRGGSDAFVVKLDPNAANMLYFTFLGGAGLDQGNAIGVDTLGNAYIAGQTASTGLATAGAAQTELGGVTDGFIAELNPSGSSFSYVTYLGGIREDYIEGLAVDAGNVYVTGYTDSVNFPPASPLQPAFPGNGVSLLHSTNSGSSWSVFDSNIPGAVFDISENPSGSSVVVLTESGLYRTANGAGSWTSQLSALLGNRSNLVRSPAAPGTIYAVFCCTSSNVYRSTDDGITWSLTGNASTNGIAALADPLTADTIYVSGYAPPSLFKSTDGGMTWNPAATGLPAGTIVGALAATSDGTLYAATSGFGVYTSTDHGGSWMAANTGLPASDGGSLSASGTTVYFAYDNIYETINGGASWAQTPSSPGASAVSASPQNPSVVYALTYGNTIVQSSDGGTTWNPTGSLPPALSGPVADPSSSAGVYVIAPVNQAAFAAKLNSTGSALIWSTYLGGGGTSYSSGSAIATDHLGDAFVAGETMGGGFPATSPGLPSSAALPYGAYSAFVTKISDATAACSTLTVSPGSAYGAQFGGTLAFSVVAPSGCAWTASTNQPWAVITSAASGTGSGILTVQTSNNFSAPTQQANLAVNSQNVTITQSSCADSFSVDKPSYPLAAGGGTVSAALTTAAGCAWTLTNNYSSAVSVTSAASGTGSAAIALSVNPNYTPNARTFTLPVGFTYIQIVQASAGNATVTLGSLSATYDGTPKSATATTNPTGLTVVFTYNGSTTAPTGAGSYTVVGRIKDATYAGSATGILAISKATATVTLGSLSAGFDGTAKAATATTTPPGLVVTFTYNGSPTAPSAVGSYTVVGTIDDPNYAGSATGTFTVFAAPAIVSLSPNSGAGTSVTFKAVYSDAAGVGDLSELLLQVNSAQSAANACYVYYQPQGNHLYLANNAGTAWITPALTPGAAGTASNSQCTLNAGSSSVMKAGNNLTLSVALTFNSTFTISRNVYLYASGLSGLNSAWVEAGQWTPNPIASPPAIVSLSPNAGAGAAVTFKAVYSDTNGAGDLSTLLLQVNTVQSSANACYVYYQPQGNHLYLANNAGTAWTTPALTPGAAGTASNSQCTLNAAASTVTSAGNNLTLSVALDFNSTFTISRNVYLYAAGFSGLNSGWVKEGTWTPNPIISPPAIVSLSPNAGAGAAVTFKAVYSDPNGAGDLTELLLQVNTSQSAGNACYVYYQPQGNHLYLANNAGSAWSTPALTPGVAGTASNSQCTLNAGSSSVITAGNDLTLNVALTFSGTVLGSQNVYLYDAGFTGLNSGWVKEGTWTPNPVAGPPAIVSLSPNSGAGTPVTFQAVYSDPNGTGDLSELLVQINTVQSSANACYVYYQPQGNHLYLANNAGSAWSTPALTPGVAGTASNSQCTLNAGSSSVTMAGNDLTLTIALTFSGTFTGAKNVYLYAAGSSGLNSAWVKKGTWTP